MKALKFKSLAGVKLRTLAAHMHAVIARLSHAIGVGGHPDMQSFYQEPCALPQKLI